MPAVLDTLLARRVVFVTGKGGTGRSTIAAALALLGAQSGRRTLAVDVDGRGDLARFLGAGPSSYTAKAAMAGLHHLAIRPEEALDEYLHIVAKIPRLYRMGPVHRVLEFVAQAAPGVEEILIAGKIAYEERTSRWDLIVVDAAPAGRVLSHIRAPRTLQDMVRSGLIRSQSEWVRETLEDPSRTGIVVVSLPEEMPVSETVELVDRAPKEVTTPILAIVANRVVAPPGYASTFESIGRSIAGVSRVVGLDATPAVEAVALLDGVARSQEPHLDRLRDIGPPVVEVPAMRLGRHALAATRRVAEALS